jgi:hypothetical protein
MITTWPNALGMRCNIRARMDESFARDVLGGKKSIMNFMVMIFDVGVSYRMKK